MSTGRERKSFVLLLTCLAIVLLSLGTFAAAKGPAVADFPSFIPFVGVEKTGDVAVDKIGNIYVNLTIGGTDQIWRIPLIGEPSMVAELGTGTAFGLALDANGDIYAAVTGQDRGVYRVDNKGISMLLPGTDQIIAANAMAFDSRGYLYVTESSSEAPGAQGGIWRVSRKEPAKLMLRHDLLTGIGATPLGANGIGYYHGNLYVVNSNKHLIVRIPILPDGSLGEPEVWKEIEEVAESLLAGTPFPLMGDGLALDVHGNIYVAMVTRLAVVRINAEDRSQETIAAFGFDPDAPLFAPMDFPNALAFGTGKGGRQIMFVTNLGVTNMYIPGPPWPGRGIMKIEVGIPGLPLP